MLKYIAAVATAVTIMICSTPVKAEQAEPAKAVPSWTTGALDLVRIQKDAPAVSTAAGAGSLPTYHLSVEEQSHLKRALLRSVKIIA